MVPDQPGRQKAVRPGVLAAASRRPIVEGAAAQPSLDGHRQGQVQPVPGPEHAHQGFLAPVRRQDT